MAKCVVCGKNVLVGGVKEGDARFCSQACRGTDFFGRFNTALAREASLNPDPARAVPQSVPASAGAGEEPNVDPDPLVRGAGELGIIGIGLFGVFAVVALIWFIYEMVRYPFFSQTFWFVVPIGAFLCGMLAGIGFLLGHRVFNRLPSRVTYLAAGLSGVAGYLLIFGLTWWFTSIGDVKLRDVVGFPQYLQLMVENQSVRFRHGAPIDLGKWGYPRFAINLVGFAIGVACMVAIAGGKAYCARCRRYLTTVGSQNRTSSDPEAAAAALHPVIAAMKVGRIQDALDRHSTWDAPERKGFFTTTIKVEMCSGCGMHLATLSGSSVTDNGNQPVQGFSYQGRTDQRLVVPG
jgi:hypothetical protein